MRVALVFDQLRDDAVGVYFARALHDLRMPFDHFWTSRSTQIPSGYDLYLRIDHGDYQADLPDHLHPRCFFVADTHLPNSWRRIRRVVPRYDLVFCAHREATRRLPNAVWIPFACDPTFHMTPKMTLRWNLAFVGSDGGVPRKFYLQALRERYPNSYLAHAPHTELGQIYGQAKVGFNYSIRNEINMRVFEVLCSGALLVTNPLPWDDMAHLGLHERRHFVVYRTPKELFDVIDYYVAHEAERHVIAAQGQAHIAQHHTYRHRLQQMLRLAAERLGVRVPSLQPSSVEVSACVS